MPWTKLNQTKPNHSYSEEIVDTIWLDELFVLESKIIY